jgi:tetratricopeptide (TPR) repeat protein
MGNPARRSGVKGNMHRLTLLLVCSLTALAQQPPEEPIDIAIRAAWVDSGRSTGTPAARERARTLLAGIPASSPRFAERAQQVAQLYQNGSLNGQARAVLEDAVARTAALGEAHPSHIAMMAALGQSWWQDGNLLKAVEYLERAAAAAAAEAASPRVASGPRAFIVSGRQIHSVFLGDRAYSDTALEDYLQLANLYQQLGRPEAAAGLEAKIRALAATQPSAVAQYFEQLGQFDKADAIYRQIAGESADPQARASAWQMVATNAARQQRFADAVAATGEAIAAVQSAEQPGVSSQVVWMRQTLAGYLRDAGMPDQADHIFQELVQQNRGGPQETQTLTGYANYLAGSARGPQGETLLKDYLAGNPNLDPQQSAGVFFSLVNIARQAGDSKRADQYQQAAEAQQGAQPSPPAGWVSIAGKLLEADAAVNQGRVADAYRLAGDAIDASPQASDGPLIAWRVPEIASVLVRHLEPAKAEQLFQRLLTVAGTEQASNIQLLTTVAQNYVNFLDAQPERVSEVPAAIERYRRVLLEANGPCSGSLIEPLRRSVEFARAHSQWPQAQAAARELLEMQESLSGSTSEPYLGDLQTAARVYQAAGEFARALSLYRNAIVLADLLATPENDWRRPQTRMDAAFALAFAGRFDEAEALGEEAVALVPHGSDFIPQQRQQLDQIRQMKRAGK